MSQFEARPSYQHGLDVRSPQRLNPDVAFVADPNTPVVLLDKGHWIDVGGTSIGAPAWAALIAIADQGRARAGLPPLDGSSQTLPALYRLPPRDFHDITRGNNGFAAGAGFDLVTGRGTPRAPLLVNDLVNAFTVVPKLPTSAPAEPLTRSNRAILHAPAGPAYVAFTHANANTT
jgi:hypothetical protein